MTRKFTKTYGVEQGFNKGKTRYFVLLNGRTTSLHYAKHDFAMQKAKGFCQRYYENFTDFQGNKVEFNHVEQVANSNNR